jgi:CheY-like chemotaxis protein
MLLVEDSMEDYEATMRAFGKAHLENPVDHCTDGDEALDYLRRRGKYGNAEDSPRPSLILLDLNLPGTDGRQVLAEIKRDPVLKKIPVIVFTTSVDEVDVNACYAAGANSYMAKPADFTGLVRAMERFKEYWLQTAIVPQLEGAS